MRLVILESPFAGSSRLFGWFQRWLNRRYARRCARDSLMRGESPYVSHLLLTQRGILCDQLASERRQGISAGLAWYAAAQASVVYIDRGISNGMRQGINAAKAAGRPVYYRTLDGEYVKADILNSGGSMTDEPAAEARLALLNHLARQQQRGGGTSA